MLNASDPGTRKSLLRLKDIVATGEKPIVIWIGAGCSLWAGLPSWKELATSIRREFFRISEHFDNKAAVDALSREDYPTVFEICRKSDSGLYHAFLVKNLASPPLTDRYKKLISYLEKIAPLYIVTTNADICLDQNIPGLDILDRSDITRLPGLISQRKQVLAKLHGSITSIDSLVFTTSDYEELASDSKYLNTLRTVFSECSILFFGYGVRDQYVLDLIAGDAEHNQLFGSGPHFLVTSSTSPRKGLNIISYSLSNHREHFGATSVLSYIEQCIPRNLPDSTPKAPESHPTSVFLSTFYPPGRHETSQTLTAINSDNTRTVFVTVGPGWRDGEYPVTSSRAFHDLLVGLLCFEVVYIPATFIAPFFKSLTIQIAATLVKEGAVRFVYAPDSIATMFPEALAPLGSLGMLHRVDKDSENSAMPARTLIERAFVRSEQNGAEVDRLVGLLENTTVTIRVPDNVANDVRGSLLMPRVSRLLGMSEAVNPDQVPHWLRFPILRMGETVLAATVSRTLAATSVTLPYGGQALASAAFDSLLGSHDISDYASYIVARKMNVNLSGLVDADKTILLRVLKFRESKAAIDLRNEVQGSLAADKENAFSSAIDGGVRSFVRSSILERAALEMQELMTSPREFGGAIWPESRMGDTCTRAWREQSLKELKQLMDKLSVDKRSPCLCGSGDSIADCCMRALRLER